MNATEEKLEVGKEYAYEENGGVERVKILETRIENGWLYVKFEVLGIVRRGLCMYDADIGMVYEVNKSVDARYPLLRWEINPL